MNKTQRYIIAIFILLVANLMLFFADTIFGGQPSSHIYFDFEGQEISHIRIENNQDTVILKQIDGGWKLNDQFKADPGFVATLLSVLERIEKGRKLAARSGEQSGQLTLTLVGGESVAVEYAVDPNRTKTYFYSGDASYEVAVPGYRDNVADIFQLKVDQWRDRMVFDGSWRTIQQVKVEQEGAGFEILFQDKFFLLNNEPPQDSTAVVEYLNQFQEFQANEIISKGRFSSLDSISEVGPIARIIIDDLKRESPKVLSIYPNGAGQNYHLVIDEANQWMVIDGPRIQRLLSVPSATIRTE